MVAVLSLCSCAQQEPVHFYSLIIFFSDCIVGVRVLEPQRHPLPLHQPLIITLVDNGVNPSRQRDQAAVAVVNVVNDPKWDRLLDGEPLPLMMSKNEEVCCLFTAIAVT